MTVQTFRLISKTHPFRKKMKEMVSHQLPRTERVISFSYHVAGPP
jgi:hypothetical protein